VYKTHLLIFKNNLDLDRKIFSMDFKIELTEESRLDTVDFTNLVFGKVFSDHMLVVDFENGKWNTPQIKPYGKFLVAPSMSALHHAQSIFEGLKVYKNENGDILFFRLEENQKRLNVSAERMCMPPVPKEIFIQGIKKLVEIDKAFIPMGEGLSLYVRPIYFATDEAIGVKASQNYRLIIFTTPTGPFYSEPLKVKIETHYSRSAEGGTGYAKAAGNYGGSFYPTKKAMEEGFQQLIWTDAKENKYVEESGAMNLMFAFDDVLVTPSLSPSKLAGITRDSIITLAKSLGIKVEERNISVDEILEKHQEGKLKEAFGVGTAAVIAPIAIMGYKGQTINLPAITNTNISRIIAHELQQIRTGQTADKFGWMEKL
jgi:branched-chain amino acid aminotransferase